MRRSPVLLLLLAAALAACARAAPAPVAPAPAPLPEPAAAPAEAPLAAGESVWNRDPGVQLRGDAGGAVLPYLGMRLEVLEVGEEEVRVRCIPCAAPAEGWIARERVVHRPEAPARAAELELADFVLAVRAAALRRDVEALRPVMPADFAHQLGQVELGLLEVLADWEREQYRSLDRVPALLDRGVASVAGSAVWAAPPEWASTLGYRDLRTGFRRGPSGWQWVFLVRDGL